MIYNMSKQIFSLTIVALFLGFFAQNTAAQGAGTNPQLYMYRYNGSPSGAPKPAVAGNRIGTLEWRALTAQNATRLGATIKSDAISVAPGSVTANMIFSTSGVGGLTERVIITENGRVGIGTMAPAFDLHTVGNTHTSGRFHGRIHFDVGQTTDLPSSYVDEAYFERKTRAQLDLGANLYPDGGILSMAPGGNSLRRQLFSGGDDGLWTRSQNISGTDTWAAWEKILTSADINGRPNLVARFLPPGPTSSKLGDSQLFDDGTNVVIGGIPAAPAAPTPAFDPADVLTVNGQTQVNGNIRTSGSATVDGNTNTNSLNVTNNAIVNGTTTTVGLSVINNATVGGNAQVNGNVGIGKAPTGFDLDVAGQSNFDGRVKIGANVFPTDASYELSVGGGIIAEEVLVRLQPWPDYVFAPNYKLKPLAEVESYIAQQKHLPGVASAKQVETEGLNLGQMQKAQMEKIEELFLHVIAMNKEMKALKAENAVLKTKMEQLENRQ